VESSDTIVITKSQEIDAILLSLNGDFSHIVNYPPKNYKGIVAMQMHNHSEILPRLVAQTDSVSERVYHDGPLPREVARRRS